MRWKLSRTVLRGEIGGNADLLLGSLENGKKQPWYITRKVNEPILMAGMTNFRPDVEQAVETGFVIVTEDSGAGMVDIHDRRPVVLEPEDALRWMTETPVEEARISRRQGRTDRRIRLVEGGPGVNRVDPNNNGKHLRRPVSCISQDLIGQTMSDSYHRQMPGTNLPA